MAFVKNKIQSWWAIAATLASFAPVQAMEKNTPMLNLAAEKLGLGHPRNSSADNILVF
jgi:hypothetical protein